jgi:hypothetical protein
MHSEPAAIDAMLDDWSQSAAKEQIAWEISASNAVLRNAQALREAQLDATMRAQQAHEQCALQLEEANSINDLAVVQMSLAQAEAQSVFEYWAKLNESTTRGMLEACAEAANGCVRWQNAAWSAWLRLSQLRALLPRNAEELEAEVEHVTNPVTASPLVWPALEATRQAMTLATNSWNDWLSWTGEIAGNGDARRAH